MARLQDLTFTYDPMGNITQVADGVADTTYFDNTVVDADQDFTYDALYRLKRATGREHPGQQATAWTPGPTDAYRFGALPHPNDTTALNLYSENYTYDESGNIVSMVHGPSGDTAWTQTYEYASTSNRLTSTTIGSATLDYPHDAHGNMMLPHLTAQTWDAFDRLQKTSTQSVGSGTPETTYYTYDSTGQRVRKVTENQAAENETPTRKSERIYLGGFEIYREYNSNAVETERQSLHVLDAKQRIALIETQTIDEGDVVEEPDPLTRYQLTNHLGSSCVEVDETGVVISFEEYYPFGGTSFHSATTAIPKRYRYTGKERDDETGLYYYGARYYAFWLGRWTACDPSGIQDGPNVFVYVKNNPVSFSDPDGKQSIALQFTAANPVRTEEQAEARIKFSKDAAVGIAESAKATVAGFKDLAVGLYRRGSVNAALNPSDFKAAWNETAQTAKAIASNPVGTAKAAAEAAVEPYEKALKEDRPGEVYGRMVYEAAAFITGVGLTKAATALRAESAVAKSGLRAAETEARLASKAEKATAAVEESKIVPKLNDVEQGRSPQLRVQVNKASGDAWSQAVGEELRANYDIAVPEITVQTQSGVRTRLDWVAKDASGNIELVEAKASAKAPLTTKQAIAHPEIEQSGAIVVGKGKEGIPGGTVIPPTKVKVKRP